MAAGIPLAGAADAVLERLARATGSDAFAALDGETLLGERATLSGFTIPGAVSAGGGCRLLPARDDAIALNLARPADRELLPALFENGALDPDDDEAIATCVARCDAATLVARGRMFGLAIAAVHEMPPQCSCEGRNPEPQANRSKPWAPAFAGAPEILLVVGKPGAKPHRHRPRIVDLSALWAGPLAAHLLWLAGAEVIKVESPARPDAMRAGQPAFYALLNQGKASVALDFRDRGDRQALLDLIAGADIVIEAARPRALQQFGIDAARIVAATPGLVWLTITGHGTEGEAANWVGFGDDVGVAGGLSAALLAASGRIGFVGDAIADPLTGLHAALAGWEAWTAGRGGRIGVAMRDVVADSLARERARDPVALDASLVRWAADAGKPFAAVRSRNVSPLPGFGSGAARWSDTPC